MSVRRAYLQGIDLAREYSVDDAEAVGAAVVAEVAKPVRVLKSEIPGVTDGQWTDLVLALKTAGIDAVSPSNAMGMFEIKPRRLADIGLVQNLRRTTSPEGRLIWAGDFVPPMTAKKFMANASLQYKALGDSMRDYMAKLCDGTIDVKEEDELPEGMTLSGALAILHRCGPSGLRNWIDDQRFSDTEALYGRCNGIF